MMIWIVAMAAGTGVQPAPSSQRPFDRAVAAVEARIHAIDAIGNVIPGRAIVAVEAGRKPVVDVHGTGRVEGPPANPDTPFYIASMTKAFVGLMAIRLDEAGIMPLDLTLAESFPQMKVRGVDLGAVTMRRLLNHQSGFTAEALNFRTAYTDAVKPQDYPQIVDLSQAPADPKFEYNNLGYLLYAAALEKRTGRSWKAWLDETVLVPLAMRHSSTRSSDLPAAAWGHERVDEAWRALPPKPDAVMHAAGGMFVSGADMARFLTAEAGGRSTIPATIFAKAHGPGATTKFEDGPMTCTGYSFGWIRCTAFGEDFLSHTGEFSGQRSIMLVVPARHVGFAAMFNSDSMTGGLGQQLSLVFLANLAGKADGQPDPAAFAERYRKAAEQYRQNRTREETEARNKPEWGDWRWSPSNGELIGYAGRYLSPAYGELRLSVGAHGLEGRLNGTALTAITPAVKDSFGFGLASYAALLPLVFQRDGEGKVTSVTAGEFRFTRSAD